MKLRFARAFVAGVGATAFLISGALEAKASESAAKQPVGFIYTTTNDPNANEVVRLERYADGTLGGEMTFATGGKGLAHHDAPANGDYDAQYQLQIVGNYLITTNGGDHTVSLFSINRPDGKLKLLETVDSHGEFPVSVAITPIVGVKGSYWVAIGNQWNNPTAIYDGDKLQLLPSPNWWRIDLTKPDATDAHRNVTHFRLNGAKGHIEYVSEIDHYNRQNGGPSNVVFSPDGKKIAVTTWGLDHFLTADPQPDLMRPSRVYVYDFADGKVSNRRYFEEEGITGSVGTDWSRNGQLLYVSNFNLPTAKNDHGLTVLRDTGSAVVKDAHFKTAKAGEVDEACWTAISPDGKKLYVVSFVTNVISTFDLDPKTGKVLRLSQQTDREHVSYAPENDGKDLYTPANGKHLYWLGSLESFSVNSFTIGADGLHFLQQYNVERTKAKIGVAGAYDLGGIDGYDLK